MATYTPLYNARALADKRGVAGEPHVVGEHEAGRVWLHEVPVDDGTLTVEIAGVPLTEVEGVPAPGEFRVHYDGDLAGAIDFNAAQAGASVDIDYSGIGSPLPAHILTALQVEKVDRDGSVAWTGAPVPAVTLTHALGSTAFRWNNIYSGGGNFSGNVTVGGTLGVTSHVLLGGASGTPWGANVIAFETPTCAMMMRTAGSDAFYILSNTYFDGALKYKNAGPTAILTVTSGFFDFTTVPAGAAGATLAGSITAMRITNGGNVLIGTAADEGVRLNVNGKAKISSDATFGGNVGFYGVSPVARPTGVPVTAPGIHAALVTLGLIAA